MDKIIELAVCRTRKNSTNLRSDNLENYRKNRFLKSNFVNNIVNNNRILSIVVLLPFLLTSISIHLFEMGEMETFYLKCSDWFMTAYWCCWYLC